MAPSNDAGRNSRRVRIQGKRRRVQTDPADVDAERVAEDAELPRRRLTALLQVSPGVAFSGPLTDWMPEVWREHERYHNDMGAYTLQITKVWACRQPLPIDGAVNKQGFLSHAPKAMQEIFRPALPLHILTHAGHHEDEACSLEQVLQRWQAQPEELDAARAIRVTAAGSDGIIAGTRTWIFCLASWTAGHALVTDWPSQAWMQAALRRGSNPIIAGHCGQSKNK